jgi:hypothetical protein
LERRSRDGPMRVKEGQPRWSHLYASLGAKLVMALDETAGVRFFPDWKPRTRRTPGFDDLRIRTRLATDPFQ